MQAGRLLDGRRLIIVGGGGVGNGRGISRGAAAAGARVAIVDVNADRAREAADEVNNLGGTALPLVADVRVQADVERAVASAVDWLGGLDSVVTVVGGYSLFTPWTPLAEVTDEQWNLIIDLNLTYVFRVVREALKVFLEQGSGGLSSALARSREASRAPTGPPTAPRRRGWPTLPNRCRWNTASMGSG